MPVIFEICPYIRFDENIPICTIAEEQGEVVDSCGNISYEQSDFWNDCLQVKWVIKREREAEKVQ